MKKRRGCKIAALRCFGFNNRRFYGVFVGRPSIFFFLKKINWKKIGIFWLLVEGWSRKKRGYSNEVKRMGRGGKQIKELVAGGKRSGGGNGKGRKGEGRRG